MPPSVRRPMLADAAVAADDPDRPLWRLTGATMARLELGGFACDLPMSYEAVGRPDGTCAITYRAAGGGAETVTLPGAAPAFRSAMVRLLSR